MRMSRFTLSEADKYQAKHLAGFLPTAIANLSCYMHSFTYSTPYLLRLGTEMAWQWPNTNSKLIQSLESDLCIYIQQTDKLFVSRMPFSNADGILDSAEIDFAEDVKLTIMHSPDSPHTAVVKLIKEQEVIYVEH